MIKRDFLLLGFGRIFQAGIALVSLRLMTTYLPKNEVGYTYLIFAIAAYFGLVFINPVGMYFNRYIHELQKKYELASFFKAMNSYFFGIGILSIPTVFFLQKVLNIGTEISLLPLLLLIFLMVYGSTWFQTLCPALNMLEKREHFIVINNIAAGLGLLFSVAGIYLFEKSAIIWILGGILGHIIGAGISFYYIKKFFLTNQNSGTFSWKILFRRSVWLFCFPVAITTLLMWFQAQSYRLVVEKFMGAEILAGLGVGLGIAASLSGIVESIVTQYYYPQYYSKLSSSTTEERAKAWELLFKNSLIIYVLMGAAIICCARPILNILVNEQYHNLAHIIILGVIIELLRILTNTVYTVSHSELKTKESILPYGFGAIFAFSGSLLVVYFAKEELNTYLSFALILASGICFIAMFIKMNRLLPLRIAKSSLAKAVLPALPLIVGYALTRNITSLSDSLFTCILVGLYVALILWKLKDNFLESKTS